MRWTTVGLAAALAWPAIAQQAPSLDPAGVRGVRDLMRSDARLVAIAPGIQPFLDWHSIGIVPPTEEVTPAQIRNAFEGNAIQAERRFNRPFMVGGVLHSVVRRPDRQIVVRFVDGGLASSQRRAFADFGAHRPEAGDFLSGATGGVMYAGAHAVLPTVHEDAVAEWQPGQKVTLRCRGASNVPLAVKLSDCVPQAAVIAEADRLADAQSELVLARAPLGVPLKREDGTVADPARASIFVLVIGYSMGLFARECTETDAVAWARCADRQVGRHQLSARGLAVQKQVARDLGVPEADVPRFSGPPPPSRPPPRK